MSDLIAIAEPQGDRKLNAVFVHGLGGHPYDTWRRGKDDNSFWPVWLAQDVLGLAVWTLGYAAPPTNWLGSAMPLQDRAINVLERLLAEPQLAEAPLVFICHSLGGLVIKQMLREANDQKDRRPEVAALLERVKSVIFIATPHTGAAYATLLDKLRLLVWPSNAVNDLVKNDANLRNLNVWYRNWSASEKIKHLIFYETQGTVAGVIVDPGSGDAGLTSVNPISVDANHTSICKPVSRTALLYQRAMAHIAQLASDIAPKAKTTVAEILAPKVFTFLDIKQDYSLPWGPMFLRFIMVASVVFMIIASFFPGLFGFHKCYSVSINQNDYSSSNGGFLNLGKERPCDSGRVVGIEWYNYVPTIVDESSKAVKNLVTGNIYINGASASPSYPKKWFEFNLFGKANRFSYDVVDDRSLIDGSFLKNGCGYDNNDLSNRDQREGRRGLSFVSDRHSDSSLKQTARDVWLACNEGRDVDAMHPCNYHRYQVFIQSIDPENWCGDDSIWRQFAWRGTYKKYLTSQSLDDLEKYAMNRWDKGHENGVPIEKWVSLTKGMPKLCARLVDDNLNPVGQETGWFELNGNDVIAAVWCDR